LALRPFELGEQASFIIDYWPLDWQLITVVKLAVLGFSSKGGPPNIEHLQQHPMP
jgi:hypothetical protein